jgi:hypothetical protein
MNLRDAVLIRSLMAVMLLTVAACGSDSRPESAGGDVATTTGGGAAASCVETYNLDNLKKRDFAFDGTVKSVRSADDSSGREVATADRVTFEVREWFKGGSSGEITLQAYGFGGTTSAGGEPRKIGDRLLVAGDEDYLWECGFTQGYDEEVAESWRRTLS